LPDLARYPLIIRHSKKSAVVTEQLFRDLHRRGVKLRVALRCQTAAGVKEAVRNKMGLGVLYRSAVKRDLRQGDFNLIRCPEVKIEGNSLIIYRIDGALSQYASVFLDLFRRDRQL
jgi:DNA-binding transcriptional LysR family regulator